MTAAADISFMKRRGGIASRYLAAIDCSQGGGGNDVDTYVTLSSPGRKAKATTSSTTPSSSNTVPTVNSGSTSWTTSPSRGGTTVVSIFQSSPGSTPSTTPPREPGSLPRRVKSFFAGKLAEYSDNSSLTSPPSRRVDGGSSIETTGSHESFLSAPLNHWQHRAGSDWRNKLDGTRKSPRSKSRSPRCISPRSSPRNIPRAPEQEIEFYKADPTSAPTEVMANLSSLQQEDPATAPTEVMMNLSSALHMDASRAPTEVMMNLSSAAQTRQTTPSPNKRGMCSRTTPIRSDRPLPPKAITPVRYLMNPCAAWQKTVDTPSLLSNSSNESSSRLEVSEDVFSSSSSYSSSVPLNRLGQHVGKHHRDFVPQQSRSITSSVGVETGAKETPPKRIPRPPSTTSIPEEPPTHNNTQTDRLWIPEFGKVTKARSEDTNPVLLPYQDKRPLLPEARVETTLSQASSGWTPVALSDSGILSSSIDFTDFSLSPGPGYPLFSPDRLTGNVPAFQTTTPSSSDHSPPTVHRVTSKEALNWVAFDAEASQLTPDPIIYHGPSSSNSFMGGSSRCESSTYEDRTGPQHEMRQPIQEEDDEDELDEILESRRVGDLLLGGMRPSGGTVQPRTGWRRTGAPNTDVFSTRTIRRETPGVDTSRSRHVDPRADPKPDVPTSANTQKAAAFLSAVAAFETKKEQVLERLDRAIETNQTPLIEKPPNATRSGRLDGVLQARRQTPAPENDLASVDVQSIRSAFESNNVPANAEDDDDNVSVRSIRSKFEASLDEDSVQENEVSKIRALFEVKTSAPRPKDFKSENRSLNAAWAKWNAPPTVVAKGRKVDASLSSSKNTSFSSSKNTSFPSNGAATSFDSADVPRAPSSSGETRQDGKASGTPTRTRAQRLSTLRSRKFADRIRLFDSKSNAKSNVVSSAGTRAPALGKKNASPSSFSGQNNSSKQEGKMAKDTTAASTVKKDVVGKLREFRPKDHFTEQEKKHAQGGLEEDSKREDGTATSSGIAVEKSVVQMPPTTNILAKGAKPTGASQVRAAGIATGFSVRDRIRALSARNNERTVPCGRPLQVPQMTNTVEDDRNPSGVTTGGGDLISPINGESSSSKCSALAANCSTPVADGVEKQSPTGRNSPVPRDKNPAICPTKSPSLTDSNKEEKEEEIQGKESRSIQTKYDEKAQQRKAARTTGTSPSVRDRIQALAAASKYAKRPEQNLVKNDGSSRPGKLSIRDVAAFVAQPKVEANGGSAPTLSSKSRQGPPFPMRERVKYLFSQDNRDDSKSNELGPDQNNPGDHDPALRETRRAVSEQGEDRGTNEEPQKDTALVTPWEKGETSVDKKVTSGECKEASSCSPKAQSRSLESPLATSRLPSMVHDDTANGSMQTAKKDDAIHIKPGIGSSKVGEAKCVDCSGTPTESKKTVPSVATNVLSERRGGGGGRPPRNACLEEKKEEYQPFGHRAAGPHRYGGIKLKEASRGSLWSVDMDRDMGYVGISENVGEKPGKQNETSVRGHSRAANKSDTEEKDANPTKAKFTNHDLQVRAMPENLPRDGLEAGDEKQHPQDGAESVAGSSVLSDGVTLDLSIAEVSNLTNPTAIRSKAGEDDSTIAGGDISTKTLDLDVDGKRSEASSSQTSEAMAPLIGKAMRSIPMSDELSMSDSRNGKLALKAAARWNATISKWEQLAKAPEGKVQSASASNKQSKEDSAWDLENVQASFKSESGSSEELFDFDVSPSGWQDFQGDDFFRESKVWDSNKPSPSDAFSSHRSPTPTRDNTRSSLRLRRAASPRSTGLENPVVGRFSPRVAPAPMQPQDVQRGVSSTTSPSGFFGRTHPRFGDPPSLDRKRVNFSNPSNEGIRISERLSDRIQPTRPSPTERNSTSPHGSKHAALISRLRVLKESRLRRTAARANPPATNLRQLTQFSINPARVSPSRTHPSMLRYGFGMEDEHSASTKSSTRFGGHTFEAMLEVE